MGKRKQSDLNYSFNKSLDKVIGEAKNELSIERNRTASDFSDYIYVESRNTEHKNVEFNKSFILDDYMDMNTIRIHHRLYTL